MTLPELIAWIDERIPNLGKAKGVAHAKKMYALLDDVGADRAFRHEWHKLAKKIAKLTKEPAPDPPTNEIVRAKKPKRAPVEINAQLQAAFDAVERGKQIIFVTGGAGTGKSTFIRELQARFETKNIVVLAPTGIAALTVGGQTIHSFCRLPLRPVLPEDVRTADDPELIEAIDLMIIDEISMVRADMLDGVDLFLRRNRKSTAPFGGVQMVFVGDLFQLPPVVTPRDAPEILQRYETPYFFSAHSLRGLSFFPVELEIVYRQRDARFAQLLGGLREGSDTLEAVVALNEHCVDRTLDGRYLTLMPTRRAAAEENEARLAQLTTQPVVFEGNRSGTFADVDDERLPAPVQLVLKPGAQVMFLRNDPERRWVNGTLGTVRSIDKRRVVVRLDDGATHEVEAIEWQDVRYTLDEETREIVDEVVGTYEQLPLMPAWAVTIHKAQGLTLDKVLVDLGRGAFAEGQVYVALSRCQTIDGLSLRRPLRPHEIRVSRPAQEFYAKIRRRMR